MLIYIILNLSMYGCSHLDEQIKEQKRGQEAKNTVMNERIARLERQVTDLNHQIDILSEGPSQKTSHAQANKKEESQKYNSLRTLHKENEEELIKKEEKRDEAIRKIGMHKESVDLTDLYSNSDQDKDSIAEHEVNEKPKSKNPSDILVLDASKDRMPQNIEINNKMLSSFKVKKLRRKPVRKVYRKSKIKKLYSAALLALKSKKYGKSRSLFDKLERSFPTNHLADNAYYWTAISFKEQKQFAKAVEMLSNLAKKYPSSNKLGDALFNLGEIAELESKSQLALKIYQQYEEMYPDGDYKDQIRQKLSE